MGGRSPAPEKWAAQIVALTALDRAAVAHARQVGKPDDYFWNCDACKEQRYLVRRDILWWFGLGPARYASASQISKLSPPAKAPPEIGLMPVVMRTMSGLGRAR
ncbi:MAG TPA: hypothetical protein VHZ07_15255 [Bryobacteraceae bacterium]|nr:hypothetical protein [Bryobacteraceae bacterium]